MTDSKHTKGPWHVSAVDETLVLGPDNRAVATTFQDEGDYKDKCDRRYADACVIAAAPELLAALKAMICWGEEPDAESKSVRQRQLCAAWELSRAAIAKANDGHQFDERLGGELDSVNVDRSLLQAAISEIRAWKVAKGGDDQVVLNLEAAISEAEGK